MAGSQLKRLKASLAEQGIIGPQKSKKEKRRLAQDKGSDKRVKRNEALEGIREQFNPFQFKTSARGRKFDVTTSKPTTGLAALGVAGRPGVAKSVGEERRRQTLLVEMQRRNKVGGIVDRRWGEGDPSMTLEEKQMERFAREQLKAHKKSNIFDLEDDDEPIEALTHGGKALTFDEAALKDDFEEEVGVSEDESEDDGMHPDRKRLKRLRLTEAGDEEDPVDDQPERKKTKKEIYEEIIAKSKLHKYERQAAKEDDEDLRHELDKALPELQALLFQRQKPESKGDQATLKIAGVDKAVVDKDYDIRVKQLAADKRAAPTVKTKTEEEIAEEESKRLKELEEKRLRRMQGELDIDSDEEEKEDKGKKGKQASADEDFEIMDNAEPDEFGLGKGIRLRPTATELGFDDEDDFEIEDDLVASGSELEFDEDEDMEEFDDDESDVEEEGSDSEDDEFTKGLLTEAEAKNRVFSTTQSTGDDKDGIPYTFECPESHEDLLRILQGVEVTKLPVAVQRIRALYHPKLANGNKEKLGNFAQALVKHIAYLGDRAEPRWYPTLESLTRHVHSLAKTVPVEVAKGYRTHIEDMEQDRPLALTVGDLFVLTAVGTTFPTSDHFHQVVTPAMLSIARFLGQKIPKDLSGYATGTYLSILAVQYQQFSKRYVPELMNFCLNTLCSLAHEKPREKLGFFPLHEPAAGIRTKDASKTTVRKLNCSDCVSKTSPLTPEATDSLKVAITSTTTAILKAAAEIWHTHPSFYETFQPAHLVLQHLLAKSNAKHLPPALVKTLADTSAHFARLLQVAQLSRRPLELHHHKPLAIKTVIPKFEDSFDPTKHYDPDRERAELAKLRKEHKRERKGAMRELRKDAQFMARENLRVKKEKDAAYEKKYKRLVAEIQGEEGRAANEYEREKAARKKKANKW
ncbi:putative nucleolar complex protein 14 [Naviculisporaceae sp. PSN 640]